MLLRARTMTSDLLGRDLSNYPPFAWYWPHKDTLLPDGSRVTEYRQTKLPADRHERRRSIVQAVQTVDAYALLLVVPEETGVVCVYFESTQGSQSWVLRPFPGSTVARFMGQEDMALGILHRPKGGVQLS